MRKGHLRLVTSNDEIIEKDYQMEYWAKFKDFFENIFLSKNEKIIIIKDSLIKIYKDYEQTTGDIDIPYFVKADIRISKIVQDRKVNYYYSRLKKFRNRNI